MADSAQNVTSAHQLECQNTITGDFQVTDISCGNGVGSLILLGFSTTLGFTTYIESCYDMITGSVRYTKHPLPGAAISCKFKPYQGVTGNKPLVYLQILLSSPDVLLGSQVEHHRISTQQPHTPKHRN